MVKLLLVSLLFMSLSTGVVRGESGTANNDTARNDEGDGWRPEKYYLSVSGGMGSPDEDSEVSAAGLSIDVGMETGFVINGAIGMYLSDDWRVELEISHHRNDVDDISATVLGIPVVVEIDGEWETTAIMANGYFDFHVDGLPDSLGFYVGAGIGAAFMDIELKDSGSSASADANVFAFQVMAGASYRLNDKLTLTGGYRLWSSEDVDFDGTEFDAVFIHTVEIGLRFDF